MKESVSIPVIASGDVVDLKSYRNTLEYTKCDAVMIGRGALGNPFVFSEITGKKITLRKIDIIKNHIDILRKYFPESFISGHIRKHLLWYLKGEKNASKLKQQVSIEPDLYKVIELLETFFKK